MVYHIGDKVHVESTKKVGDGVVSNIKYDAVRNDYEVTFDDGSKGHFCNFELSK